METMQDQLLADLAAPIAAELIDILPDAPVWAKVREHFPTAGSKIDWGRVRDHRAIPHRTRDPAVAASFFDKEVNELDSRLRGFYLNDSSIDFAIRTSFAELKSHICRLFDLPQHNYVVSDDFSWCFVFTMEGDVDCGWSPGPHQDETRNVR